jgi:carbon dioxide concentrating mechanism protein CcmN
MYLPPLQPVSNFDIYVSGDVSIHPNALIAPGVILRAAPGGRIVIDAQACLGMGVIINAYQGLIEVQSGASIGSGVLIIGTSTIGNNACIGTATTIFNASIPPMAAIAPGSLIGDKSRQIKIELQATKDNNNNGTTANKTSRLSKSSITEEETTLEPGEINKINHNINQPKKTEPSVANTEPTTLESDSDWAKIPKTNTESEINPEPIKEEPSIKIEIDDNGLETELSKGNVVGQVYINQLLLTLFPHNKGISNRSTKDEQ